MKPIEAATFILILIALLFLFMVIINQAPRFKMHKKSKKDFTSIIRDHQEDYRQRRAKK